MITVKRVNVQIDFVRPCDSKLTIEGTLDASEFKKGLELETESTMFFDNELVVHAITQFLKKMKFDIAQEEF